MRIESVKGYEFMDSRGNPTTAAKVTLCDGSSGFALAPSGASTGKFEAFELRDGDSWRYGGKGALKAKENINCKISAALVGEDVFAQRKIDEIMINLDSSHNKSNLGANAILAVSLACAKAAANCLKIPLYRYLGGINGTVLPRPMMNILNGGKHAQNNIDIQEFMIVPQGFKTFSEALRAGSEIHHALGKILSEKGLNCGVGDEGGFAPDLSSDQEAIEYILKAIEKAGYTTDNVKIALDAAASEWASEGGYIQPKRQQKFDSESLVGYFVDLCEKYPIISLEDALGEDDFCGWAKLTDELGDRVQLVGDDLFVTNTERLNMGIERSCANAILIKPNQIGTLTETLDVISLAHKNSYSAVLSHRSGETEDSSISDIAVATNCGQIKSGAPCRSDRVAKYNRLLMIESELF